MEVREQGGLHRLLPVLLGPPPPSLLHWPLLLEARQAPPPDAQRYEIPKVFVGLRLQKQVFDNTGSRMGPYSEQPLTHENLKEVPQKS